MKKKNVAMGQDGFTIIETTLFLAISAALVTVAILGTGTLIQSIRFSDSVRSTHAYIQSQYDEILNGVNPRGAATICDAVSGVDVEPGASDCLLLGKLINFDIGTSSLQTHYVISSTIPNLSDPTVAELSDEELITKVQPVVIKSDDRVETFNIPWGATIIGSNRMSDDQEVNTYVLLRSPRSSRIVSYTFQLNRSELEGSGVLALDGGLLTGASVGNTTNFCIESVSAPDPPAMITVARGQGQSAIAVEFDLDDTELAVHCEGTAP